MGMNMGNLNREIRARRLRSDVSDLIVQRFLQQRTAAMVVMIAVVSEFDEEIRSKRGGGKEGRGGSSEESRHGSRTTSTMTVHTTKLSPGDGLGCHLFWIGGYTKLCLNT